MSPAAAQAVSLAVALGHVGFALGAALAGPLYAGGTYGANTVAGATFVLAMGLLHTQDPRAIGAQGPREGARYYFPSEAKTADGNLIPAETLMADDYCLKCHQDAYEGWFHSAHHFSSFNNKAYLFSVRETRRTAGVPGGSGATETLLCICRPSTPST
jgi:hypothetical protein